MSTPEVAALVLAKASALDNRRPQAPGKHRRAQIGRRIKTVGTRHRKTAVHFAWVDTAEMQISKVAPHGPRHRGVEGRNVGLRQRNPTFKRGKDAAQPRCVVIIGSQPVGRGLLQDVHGLPGHHLRPATLKPQQALGDLRGKDSARACKQQRQHKKGMRSMSQTAGVTANEHHQEGIQ